MSTYFKTEICRLTAELNRAIYDRDSYSMEHKLYSIQWFLSVASNELFREDGPMKLELWESLQDTYNKFCDYTRKTYGGKKP